MVVCEFYKKGTCKFGTKCRNEHPVLKEENALVDEIVPQWPLSGYNNILKGDFSPEEVRMLCYFSISNNNLAEYVNLFLMLAIFGKSVGGSLSGCDASA